MMSKLIDTKLVFITFPTDDPVSLAKFYSNLLDVDMMPSLFGDLSFHAPVAADGVDIIISKRRNPREQPTPYFAVENIKAEIEDFKNSGGELLWGPEEIIMPEGEEREKYKEYIKATRPTTRVSNSMGIGALLLDPAQNQIGLVELEEQTAIHYMTGNYRQPLSSDQLRDFEFSMKNGQQLIKRLNLVEGGLPQRVPKAVRRSGQ